jgi:hypothetical protein
VLLEQRKYQRRAVFGGSHLRCLLRLDTADAMPARPPGGKGSLSTTAIAVYLPECTAAMLPLSARFRVRLVGEIRLSTDPVEAHPLALKVLALARTVPAAKR